MCRCFCSDVVRLTLSFADGASLVGPNASFSKTKPGVIKQVTGTFRHNRKFGYGHLPTA